LIYEKKGDSLEAEAVRLSIPAGWTPSTPESLRSGKQYILDHKSLIDLAFGRSSAEPASSSTTNAPEGEADVPKSGHWTTLTPRALSDGLQRAKRDERTGAPVGNTDTGKEFLFQNREELIPRRRTEMGILRAINDEYSGKQLGEFDSGKEIAVDTIGNSISDNLPVELPATESKRPRGSISTPTYSGIKFEPWWPMPSSCMWENIRAPLTAVKIRQKMGRDWFSTLELVFQISVPETTREAHSRNLSSPNLIRDNSSARISWNFEKGVDIRSQNYIIIGLVMALDRTVVDAIDPNTVSCNIGVGLGLGDASFGMSHGYGSEVLCVSIPLLITNILMPDLNRYLFLRILVRRSQSPQGPQGRRIPRFSG